MMRILKTAIYCFTVAALLVFGVIACRKLEDKVMNDVSIGFNPGGFLSHKITIQVVNANDSSRTIPIATIAVEGKDADKVFDINGSRTIKIDSGMATLVVNPGQDITEPLQFSIVARANGFEDLSHPVEISSADEMSHFTLMMTETASPLQGLSQGVQIMTAAASSAAKDLVVTVPLQTGVEFPQAGTLTIPGTSKLYNASNVLLSGTISAKMVLHNCTDPVVDGTNPFNNPANPIVLMRNNLEYLGAGFEPLSIIDVNATVGTQAAATSSPAMSVTLEMGRSFNLATRLNYTEGDNVEVFRNSGDGATWLYVATVKLGKGGGTRLSATFSATNFGQYAVLPMVPTCAQRMTISFTRPNKIRTRHYLYFETAVEKRRIKHYQEVLAGNGVNFLVKAKLPKNTNYNIYLYEKDFISDKGRIIAQKLNVPACATAVTLDMPASPDIMQFDLTVSCKSSGPGVFYAYAGEIFFRPLNGSRFYSMGVSDATGAAVNNTGGQIKTAGRSYLETDRLAFNTQYQFQTEVTMPAGNNTFKTVKYTRTRITYRNPKPNDIDAPVIGYFLAPTTGAQGQKFYMFYKLDKLGGTPNNWLVPADACKDFGF